VKHIFLYSTGSTPALRPNQPTIQRALGALPGCKGPRREADHSPPSRAEVKNGGAIPLFPHAFSWRGSYLRTGQLHLTLRDRKQQQALQFLLVTKYFRVKKSRGMRQAKTKKQQQFCRKTYGKGLDTDRSIILKWVLKKRAATWFI
jgi:hypothetical protein